MPALKAAVDDLGPHFLVLAPGDPRLLEGLAGREGGPADPPEYIRSDGSRWV